MGWHVYGLFLRPVPRQFNPYGFYLEVCVERLEIILKNFEISLELEWSLRGFPLQNGGDRCQPPTFSGRDRLGPGWSILWPSCLLPLTVWCHSVRVWNSWEYDWCFFFTADLWNFRLGTQITGSVESNTTVTDQFCLTHIATGFDSEFFEHLLVFGFHLFFGAALLGFHTGDGSFPLSVSFKTNLFNLYSSERFLQ